MEWLGEVPEHWEVRRLRSVCDTRFSNVDKHTRDEEASVRLCNYVDVYKNDHIHDGMPFMRATATESEIAHFRLHAGDVLITKDSEAWDDIGVPALVVDSDIDAICGYHLAILRSDRRVLEGTFLFRALQSQRLAHQFHVAAAGVTRYGLSQGAVRSLLLPLPTIPEQAAIARFLDHADRRIRRYIATKEKLIVFLEEQKQALIQQAVTGQIDVRTGKPYPAYKDSGVEWLGEVPEHWMIWAAKRFYYESDERSVTGTEELLSVSHLTGVTPRSEKNVTMFKAESHVGHKLCRTGDLVVNTMWAWMAALGLARQDGLVSPSYAVYRCRPSAKLDGEYVESLLRTVSYRDEYRRRSTGIRPSRLRLYPDEFLLMPILCPTPEEQRSIVEYLAETTSKTGAAIQGASRQIDLLRELRTRLIADVVTGKLDVREAAARIPDLVSSADDAPSTIPTPE